MQQTIEVSTADFAAAGQDYVLSSSGIGSCLVVCIYDKEAKIGALGHIMLPKHPQDSELNPLRFADTAIPLMLEKLAEMGADRARLHAQLFGGASMFKDLGPFINKIGGQNIAAVQQLLAQQYIPITRMDVGGNAGRSVTFDLSSGDVTVTTKV
jgi:chemotaxis protein CheD